MNSAKAAIALLVGCFCFALLPALRPPEGYSNSFTSYSRRNNVFPGRPPFLAVITEPDACATEHRVQETLLALRQAVSTGRVGLVSVRLAVGSKPDSGHHSDDQLARAVKLTRKLVELSDQGRMFKVVCSSDLVHIALGGGAHGIHVKEAHLSRIPEIRSSFGQPPIIGTSAHSVDSALSSYEMHQPDYYFLGTCFLTGSHPEKSLDDLEGPQLAGSARAAIKSAFSSCTSKFLAIGGIDENNCNVPLKEGADGVAVIRSVLKASDPAVTASKLYENMSKESEEG